MKFLVTGLPLDITIDGIKEGMAKFGPVSHVEMVEKGKAEPWAIVEMAVTPEQAFNITQKVQDVWYAGNYINIRILNH